MQPWVNNGTSDDVRRILYEIAPSLESTADALYRAASSSALARATYLSLLATSQHIGVCTADAQFEQSLKLYESGLHMESEDAKNAFVEASGLLARLLHKESERQAAQREQRRD